ncbi:hypothetical protein [Sutcliffiella horikoshii]|uniref:hypothetical protein n=1 Tax=Sutcliffiella horikoshii TaxID=79883 RepID=UPI001F1F5406|nr:hypothetical protein [Sutcliffiella horikoshii]MCG1023759.1 hypothetical protein [Sutcliffiella horikoshii]
MMLALGLLGVLVLVGGLLATLQVAGKGDHDYQKKSESNVRRLTYIYIALFVVIIVGFIVYLRWFV